MEEGEQPVRSLTKTTHTTKPLPRFSEATLADAMKNAWRFVAEEKYKEKLKETNGIGTQATRAAIIDSLKDNDILKIEGKFIVPTKKALDLYEIINNILPDLIDPAVTAKWDLALTMIEQGKLTLSDFQKRVEEKTLEYLKEIQENKEILARKPSEKQVKLAKTLALQHEKPLPNFDDFHSVKDFIDDIFKKIESGELEKVFSPT